MTPFTRVTIESEHLRASIEVPHEHITFADFYEMLLVPALKAYGYQQETLDNYFGEGDVQ